MALDLTLSSIYRINGQEIPSLPGLAAQTPPQNAARGRERDRLIVYLLLTGNSTFSTSEYLKVAQDAAAAFYKTSGALTSALRTAADHVNKTLFDRNMTTNLKGQYAVGWLTLAVLRDSQCTLSLSGPMHAYWFGQNESRHIHEPLVSGKGLGSNQTTSIHYAQTTLSAGDRLLFFGRAPSAWDSTLNDAIPSSMDAMRRRLLTLTSADLNAVLIQATDGAGVINHNKETTESKVEKKPVDAPPDLTPSLPQQEEIFSAPVTDSADAPQAHVVQPSAYAIQPEQEAAPLAEKNPLANLPHAGRDFPVQ